MTGRKAEHQIFIQLSLRMHGGNPPRSKLFCRGYSGTFTVTITNSSSG
jgi:hypothetical protein